VLFKITYTLQSHLYKIFFLCELTGGSAKKGIEADDIGFFAENELPELSTGRITEKQISRFFEHLLYPDLQTDFD